MPATLSSPAMGPRRIAQPEPELIVDEDRRDARPFPGA